MNSVKNDRKIQDFFPCQLHLHMSIPVRKTEFCTLIMKGPLRAVGRVSESTLVHASSPSTSISVESRKSLGLDAPPDTIKT